MRLRPPVLPLVPFCDALSVYCIGFDLDFATEAVVQLIAVVNRILIDCSFFVIRIFQIIFQFPFLLLLTNINPNFVIYLLTLISVLPGCSTCLL